jgi:Bacterial protein of unknown function (DUF839)
MSTPTVRPQNVTEEGISRRALLRGSAAGRVGLALSGSLSPFFGPVAALAHGHGHGSHDVGYGPLVPDPAGILSLGHRQQLRGGRTPWETWLTREETEAILGNSHGYVFEVDPYDWRANRKPTPIKALGRFAHESVVVDPGSHVIYQTEDAGSPNGLLLRWIPPRWALPLRGGRQLELKLHFAYPESAQNNDPDGPDNITVSAYGGLIIAEDGEGVQHLVGTTGDGEAFFFARNEDTVENSEFAASLRPVPAASAFPPLMSGFCELAFRWSPVDSGSAGCHPVATLALGSDHLTPNDLEAEGAVGTRGAPTDQRSSCTSERSPPHTN